MQDGHKTSRLDILMAVLVLKKKILLRKVANILKHILSFKAPRCFVVLQGDKVCRQSILKSSVQTILKFAN